MRQVFIYLTHLHYILVKIKHFSVKIENGKLEVKMTTSCNYVTKKITIVPNNFLF